MLEARCTQLGSGQVRRRYLASMYLRYLWGRPRPACQTVSHTEVARRNNQSFAAHSHKSAPRGTDDSQAARLLVSRPASFPIGVFATRLHFKCISQVVT
ncbi:uncharacterized protein PgNI_08428 [Pyricularia grisea]|uniref:Uncharacterized protein n=1 Tax=Pyricularia grisea TaxID=148305 RepID=A0A6P8AW35_PYRGI|nr:uncharacterized protein PgNI_08428 [Pyricularia grisea]TLD06438.1 hypothetical protein PgNI_08428 [Pyricularia grisea]